MAELNLNQITQKLNAEFVGDVRKLVFWYDPNAEFADDIDALVLDHAKVLRLEEHNQFYIKHFLECEDRDTSYLIYAPFAKPSVRENHLADTIRYSKEFTADRATMISMDLGIEERYKPVIQKYNSFFANKRRTQAFYDLELDALNHRTIEIGLMSVLCKCKTASFEEVVRAILTDVEISDFTEHPYLAEFDRYDLTEAFWRNVADSFGYSDPSPSLEKFIYSLFVTYAERSINAELPMAWKNYLSEKSGNSIVFLDNLMNSYIYSDRFDLLSQWVYERLQGEKELKAFGAEAVAACNLFAGVDDILLQWLTERLELEDVSAKLSGKTIPEVVKTRRQSHFGRAKRSEYFVLENAWHLLSMEKYADSSTTESLAKAYTETYSRIDRRYRYYYYYLDRLDDASMFEKLTELVENIYTNDYLSKICANWSVLFSDADKTDIEAQISFFDRHLKYAKDQTIVFISDAMRYEVGLSLFEKLQADEKCTASISVMTSVLPSITRYGMASLLPHKTIGFTDGFEVRVDDVQVNDLNGRQAVLQKYKQNSRCIQFDDIAHMNKEELRGVFTGQDVVYVYHNQIDARGDKANTENEVFLACEEAVEEIASMIRRLTTSANKSHFIVTADHGFIYKRNKLAESDKVQPEKIKGAVYGRRYVLSDAAESSMGVRSVKIDKTFRNGDERVVSFPIGADIFKLPGAGQNYVHGGCSPQEMLIPLIEVKTKKEAVSYKTVQVALVSLTTKITNLITTLDFVQTEAVSDVVKETTYRIFFIDENGTLISGEQRYVADRKEAETAKRIFKCRFSFKNQKYDRAKRYYLVAVDEQNDLEVLRHEVMIDIAFVDDFGF